MASLLMTSIPFKDRVNLHGGSFSTRSMSIWELYRYRDTELLRKEPLSWCPFKSYQVVSDHITIENRNNRNWLIIDTDIIELVKADADYNRKHAKTYKGTDAEKVWQIYKYCRRTKYVAHLKTARSVFEDGQGDCSAIAEAFYVMCKKNHIPVRYVIGWADGECHAWNRVKVGKRWYWVDATLGKYLKRKQFKGRTTMEVW